MVGLDLLNPITSQVYLHLGLKHGPHFGAHCARRPPPSRLAHLARSGRPSQPSRQSEQVGAQPSQLLADGRECSSQTLVMSAPV